VNTRSTFFKPLTIVMFCLVLDFMGLGLILPVLNNLFKDTSDGLFSPGTSQAYRTAIYLALSAVFFLGTFFGAPVIGAMGDKYGRRKLILFTSISTCISTSIVLAGIWFDNIYFIFLGRLIAGLLGGMLIIFQSTIADISTTQNKAKNFGMIGIAFGIGFSVGPILGSVLSDHAHHPAFGYYLPYALATLINIVNVLFIYYFYEETLAENKSHRINYFKGLSNIKEAVGNQSLRHIFLIILILATGFSLYLQSFQSSLIDIYHFKPLQIAFALLYVGAWIAIAQGLILRLLLKKFQPQQILLFSIPLMAISFLLLLSAHSIVLFFCYLPVLAISQGCTFPSTLAMISNQSDEDHQGKVLGINQSVQAIASSMPLLLGIIAFVCFFYESFVTDYFPQLIGANKMVSNPKFTLIFGVISSLIGYLIYLFNLRQNKLKS
jgi:MFS transporter, DHA1 family, tetracycline resistance protein